MINPVCAAIYNSAAGIWTAHAARIKSLSFFLLCLFILTSDRKEKKPEGLQNKHTEPSTGVLVSHPVIDSVVLAAFRLNIQLTCVIVDSLIARIRNGSLSSLG